MTAAKKIPYSREELNDLLMYIPETGDLYRRKDTRFRRKGTIADSEHNKGYRALTIGANYYLSHRVIWKMIHGTEPEEIDHINGVRDDNRLSNLRAVTKSQNQHNSALRTDCTSGYRGVSFHKASGKWQARLQLEGKRHNLGLFLSPEEAHAAVQKFITAQPTLEGFRNVYTTTNARI